MCTLGLVCPNRRAQVGMGEAEMDRLKSLSCLQRDLKVTPGRPLSMRDSMRDSS